MKIHHTLFIFISLFLITACNCNTKKTSKAEKHVLQELHEEKHEHKNNDANAHWAYEGKEGPSEWATLCPAYSSCNGKRQSPIDLSSNTSTESTVIINTNYHCVGGTEFINNGHSIQVNFPNHKPNVLSVNNKNFELKQFHFHCPSEHTMDGQAFEGEAHFVHVAKDGDISVVGIFLVEGAKSAFFDNIISHIPSKAGDKKQIPNEICTEKVFSTSDQYYVYEGSLTTPPCTEGVNWFVRKQTMEVSAEQIAALKKVMPANNARPVQNTNNREFGKLDKQ